MHCACALLIGLTVLCTDTVVGYPSGKISIACGNMIAEHGHDPSPDPPPYTITVDKTTFSRDENVTVTLQVAATSGSTYFKGFLMEARDMGKPNNPAIGSFSLVDPTVSQLLTCGHIQGSGVSHTSSSKKTSVQAVWADRENPPEQVQFFVTVVHKYKVYWVKIAGPVVSLKGPTAVPTAPVTAVPTEPPAVISTPFSSEGCGRSKSCLRDPVDCHPETDPGCYFLSFASGGAGRSVMFELSGPAEGYVSFALSLDKWMGNDDAYLCVKEGDTVNINAAYVSGRTHPEVASETALWGEAWRLSDSVIQCRFHRNVLLPHLEGRFNLNQSYFLFLAHGRADHGFIHRHDRQPLISTHQTVITGPPEDLTGSRSPLLIKFHGLTMLMVWMCLVTTGVLTARHFKQDWPDTTLLRHRVWFQMHRGLMVLAVCLTCVAFTFPFLYRGGWSKHAGAHPFLGCIVLVLSVVQPIMAVLRPAPESRWRYIFNWMHLGTGTSAQILAVACIFLGVGLQALQLPGSWSRGVLGGWVTWVLLADLVLLLLSKRLRIRGYDGEDKQHILVAQPEDGRQDPKLKRIVFVVFLIGNVGFLGALVNTITHV